jgi:hypothetical protein
MNPMTAGSSRWNGITAGTVLPWLAIAALWLLTTEYARIGHDALLYSFQAIAHLHPELYSGDVYLRYGSQDNFSAFSSIYSMLVGWLGFEGAAAWTTFVAMIALLRVAWLLARRLVPAQVALMGLACLVALPKSYGAYGIFRVVEPFVSPRMPAEALAVCALLAIFSGRRLLGATLLIGSASMHPLMAAPAALIALYLVLPPEKRRLLLAASALGLVILAIVGSLSQIDPLRIDAEWRKFLDGHAVYLFTANWTRSDWMGLCPPTLTLLLGTRVLESGQSRQLCVAALFAGFLGFAIMLIGADWLRIAIVVQGQGYRWVWPATLFSLLLFPAVAMQLWRRGTTGRAAALALAAVWLSPRESFGPMIAFAAALAGIIAVRDLVAPPYRRWVLIGAALMLFIAAAFSLAERVMIATSPYFEGTNFPLVEVLRDLCVGGLIPAVLLVGVFALANRPSWRFAQISVALGLLGICVLLVPVSHATWSQREYDPKVQAAFATWRTLIPTGSEVVWIEKPEAAWLLLERPSYYSLQQSMSGVFKRDAAREITAREARLIPFMQADSVNSVLEFLGEPRKAERAAAPTLDEVCKAVDARFLVARSAFPEKFLAAAPAGVPSTYRAMKLYRCDPPST